MAASDAELNLFSAKPITPSRRTAQLLRAITFQVYNTVMTILMDAAGHATSNAINATANGVCIVIVTRPQ